MSNLPLFNKPKMVSTDFDHNADIVVFNGDTGDLIDTIPDNYVKLIITSPPYNLGKSYEDQVSIDNYLDTQAKTISKLYRVLHPEGSICWQVGNFVQDGEVFPLDIFYYRIFKGFGLSLPIPSPIFDLA